MFGKIVIFSFISLFVLHIFNVLDVLDVWKVVEKTGPRNCYNVPGIKYGAEDIQVIKEKEVAIVSSGFIPHLPSNIFMVKLANMDSLSAEPFSFETSFDKSTFHPHGIYVKKSRKGSYHLYVVNHHNEFECVDIFEIDLESKILLHVKRIIDPLFKNMNDIVVIDDFVFYVTNWFAGRNKVINFLQGLLMLPVGDVIFYNGNVGIIAIKNLFIPNGIVISPDQKFVYVGLSGSKAIAAYSRNPDNTLDFVKQYNAVSLVDNVDYLVDENGEHWLWFAGPYRMFESSLRVFKILPGIKVPSYFSRFSVAPDGSLTNLVEIFIDDGSLVSGASSVVKYKNYVMIGTVDDHMTVCSHIA